MPEAQRQDRLERLTNLVLVLLDTRRPLTLRELADMVAGYPAGAEAARQAFERDKRALRSLGIPIAVEPLEGEEQAGYRIRKSDYYLPDLELSDEEKQALGFAVAAVQLGGSAGSDALAKLGGSLPTDRAHVGCLAAGADPALPPVAVLPSLPALGAVHEAIRVRARLFFSYRGRRREVEPYVLAFRSSAWYLVGRELSAGDGPRTKTFRVDRFSSEPELGPPGSFESPAALHVEEINLLPWSVASRSEEQVPVAELVVDARLSALVAGRVAEDAVVGTAADGSVRFRLKVADEAAFVSFVSGLGDAAVVESPDGLRAAVVERLQAVAHGQSSSPSRTPVPRKGAERPPRAKRPRSGQLVAGERLRRLLAILAHMARVHEASLAELSERFGISEDELVGELELAACCGVPPYTPDQLIALYVDGDKVVAEGLLDLHRPQLLTAEEGFALAAAAHALLEVPGAGDESPLRSALSKLEEAIGGSKIALDIEVPESLEELKAAAEASEEVEIEYFKSAASAPSARVVEPYEVVLREGRWYMDGWYEPAGGFRRFQLGRVLAVRRTGRGFERPPDRVAELASLSRRPEAFLGGPDAIRARIVFPAVASFAVEPVARGELEEAGDGRLAAEVEVGDVEGWFGRLMIQLGPDAFVLEPADLAGAGREAARRALQRYLPLSAESGTA